MTLPSIAQFTVSEPRLPVSAVVDEAAARLRDGQPARALQLVAALLDAPGLNATHCTILGLIAMAAGDPLRALDWHDRALTLAPITLRARLGRAEALAEAGRHREADYAFREAIAMGCDDASAHFSHGVSLRALGARDAAIAAFDRALQRKPDYPEALRAGAAILAEGNRKEEAVRFLSEALRLRPNYIDAILDCANLLDSMSRAQAALAILDQGLASAPGDARLLNNRGVILYHLGRMPEAIATLDRAILVDPSLAESYLNKGEALIRLGAFEAAVQVLAAALARRPDYVKAHCAQGIAYKLLARFAEAGRAFEKAVANDPACPYALTNRGELRLLQGDFSGWGDYEARWLTRGHDRPLLGWQVPQWAGQADPGSVLVFADQAAGDVLHFARYLTVLREAGAAITLVCRKRMQRLLRPVSEGCLVLDEVPRSGMFDYQIPLSNMPFACGTVEATIPPAPYLAAEPSLIALWRERVGEHGCKIGLCWRGSQDWRSDPKRSVPLENLRPLADLPGVRLISLQMPDNLGPDLASYQDMGVETITPAPDQGPDGFVDTAAVMANMDLIVTCDTSIAHLAGALGCPTFVLLQLVPEWRFLLEREDSPWYATMRLFRQVHQDDWTTPVARICAEVAARVN